MEWRTIKYWSLIIILSYLPTISVHYIVRPAWYNGIDSYSSATSFELLFTVLILPIYLVVINYFIARKFSKLTVLFLLNAVMIISCIIISTRLHLKNWTDSIGTTPPDYGTEALMDFERFIGIGVSILGFIIIYFIIRKEAKSES